MAIMTSFERVDIGASPLSYNHLLEVFRLDLELAGEDTPAALTVARWHAGVSYLIAQKLRDGEDSGNPAYAQMLRDGALIDDDWQQSGYTLRRCIEAEQEWVEINDAYVGGTVHRRDITRHVLAAAYHAHAVLSHLLALHGDLDDLELLQRIGREEAHLATITALAEVPVTPALGARYAREMHASQGRLNWLRAQRTHNNG